MTEQTDNTEVIYSDMDETTFREKNLQLDQYEYKREQLENDLTNLDEELKLELPNMITKDKIAELDKQITTGKIQDQNGNESTAFPSEIEMMKLKGARLVKELESDRPMRKLRMEIRNLRLALEDKVMIGNMKVLKEEIRNKKNQTVVIKKDNTVPVGVN